MSTAIPATTPSHADDVIDRIDKAALAAMSQQLPVVNDLLEKSFDTISTDFIAIATQFQHYKNQPDEKTAQEIQQKLQALVMQMQFQDRVSQNIVIAQQLCEHLTEHNGAPDPIEYAKAVMEILRLGEIRDRFIAELQQCGVITSGEELGYVHEPTSISNQTDDDDIELF